MTKTFILNVAMLFFSLVATNVYATHIVGGEIQFDPLTNSTLTSHRVTLNLYFDAISGNANAEDLTITLYFFRKKNDEQVGTAVLQRVARNFITYNSPACERGDLKTLLIKYQADLKLTLEVFSDTEGYYVTWERCCRNAAITNISDPGGTGMVFYLEFPPITILNSSPRFADIVADYICINQQFLFDFSAFDDNGDSLSYQLMTPWAGYTNRNSPMIAQFGSKKYPDVVWNTGFSLANVMGSDQPLFIDPITGVLTIKSSRLGLFVFSVMVNEYRKGKLIGRVKRDFQIKVIDCKLNIPPELVVKDANTNKLYKDGDVVILKKNDKKCFNIAFTDADLGQNLVITSKGLNIDSKSISIASPTSLTISKAGDSLKTQVCLDNCAISKTNDPVTFALTVTDNGCPASLKKTLIIQVKFEESTPLDPKVSTTLPDNIVNVTYGDTLKFKVNGEGVPADTIQLLGSSPSYALTDLGIVFLQPIGITKVSSNFVFVPNCNAVKAGKIPVIFTTKEFRCTTSKQISTSVFINVLSIPNNKPVVSTTLPANQVEIVLNPSENQEVSFDVNGKDVDNSPKNQQQLATNIITKGFVLSEANMSFTNQNGFTTKGVFTWKPSCKILNGKELQVYDLYFVTNDNACLQKQDSVKVHLVIKDINNTFIAFQPFNTFTPNGDNINDYFSLENLPNDNCKRQFIGFELFNRWGKSIYISQDRKFRWTGEDYPAGEYFYAINFSDGIMKGIINLVR